MVLPTEVNYINDSKERVKIAYSLSTGQSSFTLDPGENRRISGSWNGGYDIASDIIINPQGPNNNIKLGNFIFNNPAIGRINVRSDNFYYHNGTSYRNEYSRPTGSNASTAYKRTWGVRPENYEEGAYKSRIDNEFSTLYKSIDFESYPTFDKEGAYGLENNDSVKFYEFLGFEPYPIFDIEVFPQDDGAKKWDLHIKKVTGKDFAALENPLYSMNIAS